jgi:hypothetical protein
LDERAKSESHAGVLRSTERVAGEFFEFGGHKLPLEGTSGPPKEPARSAEGRPIRHDREPAERNATDEFFQFGGQTLPREGTSGPPKEPFRTAEGSPVRHLSIAHRDTKRASRTEGDVAAARSAHSPVAPDAASGSTGSGQLIGEPVRRA